MMEKRIAGTITGITLVLLLASMLTMMSASQLINKTTTANARGSSIRGTCDTWYSKEGTLFTDAKIIQSSWRIVITGSEKAVLFMNFIELNVVEEIPGTYDYFVVKMDTDDVQVTSDGFIISGTSSWTKNDVTTFTFESTITISEGNFPAQFRIDFDVWEITGSLTP